MDGQGLYHHTDKIKKRHPRRDFAVTPGCCTRNKNFVQLKPMLLHFLQKFFGDRIASIDKGTRGSAGRKCPHTASKPLRIHKVFSTAFSLSASISAPAELLRIGQPWIFEGFLFFWTQAGCRPPRTKGQKAPKRLTCPTCVLLLIDACIIAKNPPDGNTLSGGQLFSFR